MGCLLAGIAALICHPQEHRGLDTAQPSLVLLIFLRKEGKIECLANAPEDTGTEGGGRRRLVHSCWILSIFPPQDIRQATSEWDPVTLLYNHVPALIKGNKCRPA